MFPGLDAKFPAVGTGAWRINRGLLDKVGIEPGIGRRYWPKEHSSNGRKLGARGLVRVNPRDIMVALIGPKPFLG